MSGLSPPTPRLPPTPNGFGGQVGGQVGPAPSAQVAQLAERLHGKQKVRGSIPRLGLEWAG